MILRVCLILSLLIAQPANAGCFLFFCFPSRHHVRHHHYHPRIIHKTIVKKVIIVREHKRKAPAARGLTPITPLK